MFNSDRQQFNKDFDKDFKDIKKTVKRGAGIAILGALFGLVIYGCIAVTAV